MARNRFLTSFLLWPLSKIYGLVVCVRNRMFDIGILKQREFDIPVVSIGNIAVGGTGKTPHTEYVINMLRDQYNIGVLSRGYKRHTKGFVHANKTSTAFDIGDEPYQMYQKYGDHVMFAVCENRCRGIERMREINPDLNLIILDDAFQHRYVKPKVSVVLTEFNRPVFYDKMLPLGRLRESVHALNRADMVIVTKCPEDIKPMDYRVFKNNLNLYPYQKLFFSRYIYGNLVSVFPEHVTYIPYLEWLTKSDSVLIISGIANPRPLVKHLRQYKFNLKIKLFTDHHTYTEADFRIIENLLCNLKGDKRYIVTTEKDAVKLIENPLFPEKLKSQIFYIPIKVQFIVQNSDSFETELHKLIKSKHI